MKNVYILKEPFKNVEVMNSAKLQVTKSTQKTQLYFYTPEMSNQLRKLRKKFYLQNHQKEIQYSGTKLTKEMYTYTLKTRKYC